MLLVRKKGLDEELRNLVNKSNIVIDEIPYQVNKAKLIESIVQLVRDKKLEGIADIKDESDKSGIRVVIELKRQVVSEVVLNHLLKFTALQVNFGVNMMVLNDGTRPSLMSLKEVIVEIANNRDAQGQAVFSGFKTNLVPFLKELDGSVSYVGDRGQHTVQISESMKVKTSIDGGTTFMAVPTESGVKSVFEIIDNARNTNKWFGI